MKRVALWVGVVLFVGAFAWYYRFRIQPVDWTNQAISMLRRGKFQEALPLLERSNKRMPDNPRILNPLAECYWALKQYSASRKVDRRLLKIVPGHKQALQRLKTSGSR